MYYNVTLLNAFECRLENESFSITLASLAEFHIIVFQCNNFSEK